MSLQNIKIKIFGLLVSFTIPGCPLYEKPGLINDITGVTNDKITIKTINKLPVHHQELLHKTSFTVGTSKA